MNRDRNGWMLIAIFAVAMLALWQAACAGSVVLFLFVAGLLAEAWLADRLDCLDLGLRAAGIDPDKFKP